MARKSAWELARSGATFRELLIDAVDDIAESFAGAEDDRVKSLEQVTNAMQKYQGPLGRWAVGMVFEEMGLDIDPGEGLSRDTLTRAINAGPLASTGLEFRDLFDRQAVIDDLMQFGIKKVAESFGLGDVSSVSGGLDGIKRGIVSELSETIAEQVASEAGELIEGAPDKAQLVAIIAGAVKKEGWNDPVDFTDKGVNNRERQARWRARNIKIWIER